MSACKRSGPSAPYVGIWTRTTSFRREALERELVRGTVVKATVIRQTLWSAEGGRVAVEPFASLSRAAAREVKEEAARLQTFLA